MDFQRATKSLLRPLADLAAGRVGHIDESLQHRFRDVSDHAVQADERARGFRDLLDGTLQANLALIGLQENRDQRKISAWAAIGLIPTVIAGALGMNVGGIPLAGTPVGFVLLVVVMCASSALLYWRLRRAGWL